MNVINKRAGFTLIEVMIVVAIIAILAAVTYPSYQKYALRTNRAQAKAALLDIQVAQEKFFMQHKRYVSATADISKKSPFGLGLPTTTENGRYDITIAGGSDDLNFTVVATAKGVQQADADCLVFTIDDSGTRTPPPSSTCWR